MFSIVTRRIQRHYHSVPCRVQCDGTPIDHLFPFAPVFLFPPQFTIRWVPIGHWQYVLSGNFCRQSRQNVYLIWHEIHNEITNIERCPLLSKYHAQRYSFRVTLDLSINSLFKSIQNFWLVYHAKRYCRPRKLRWENKSSLMRVTDCWYRLVSQQWPGKYCAGAIPAV